MRGKGGDICNTPNYKDLTNVKLTRKGPAAGLSDDATDIRKNSGSPGRLTQEGPGALHGQLSALSLTALVLEPGAKGSLSTTSLVLSLSVIVLHTQHLVADKACT